MPDLVEHLGSRSIDSRIHDPGHASVRASLRANVPPLIEKPGAAATTKGVERSQAVQLHSKMFLGTLQIAATWVTRGGLAVDQGGGCGQARYQLIRPVPR